MDTFITRQEFLDGVQWYWQDGDTDVWYYDSNENTIKQVDGSLYADVNELGVDNFTYTHPGEDAQSYPYTWLIQSNA